MILWDSLCNGEGLWRTGLDSRPIYVMFVLYGMAQGLFLLNALVFYHQGYAISAPYSYSPSYYHH